MRRLLLTLLVISTAALGFTLATPGAASADPVPISEACTATGTLDKPVIGFDNYGQPILVGYHRFSYVGSVSWLLGTYRIWHVSYRNVNSNVFSYVEAYAARCVDGVAESTVDLTRTPAQAITSPTDALCGTTNFTAGSSTYTYIGSRFNNGDTFRYWRRSYSSQLFFFVGPYAARCA